MPHSFIFMWAKVPVLWKVTRMSALLIGMASSGLHSNGYSLVRRIVGDRDLHDRHGLSRPLADELLEPTKVYAAECLLLRQAVEVHAFCHVTGGGLPAEIWQEVMTRVHEGMPATPLPMDRIQERPVRQVQQPQGQQQHQGRQQGQTRQPQQRREGPVESILRKLLGG